LSSTIVYLLFIQVEVERIGMLLGVFPV